MEEVRRRRGRGRGGAQDVVSMLVQRPLRGRLADERARPARRTADAALRRSDLEHSLAWAFERLLRNPEKLARPREDVRAATDAYLDAVIKETLRLARRSRSSSAGCCEPMTLGGHELPAGTTVAPCIHLIHRDEAHLPAGRAASCPERFLEPPPGTYTWIPFGGGIRRCLAASYAEMEMKRVLRTVLQRGRPAAGRAAARSGCAKARSPSAPTAAAW